MQKLVSNSFEFPLLSLGFDLGDEPDTANDEKYYYDKYEEKTGERRRRIPLIERLTLDRPLIDP